MSWLVLFIAGLLEVVWAVGLKYTHGFSRDGLRRLDRNRRGRRSRDGYYPAGRIRQPDAHCQPGVHCDWHHWPENERALILLIDP